MKTKSMNVKCNPLDLICFALGAKIISQILFCLHCTTSIYIYIYTKSVNEL